LNKEEIIALQASTMVGTVPSAVRERILRDRIFCQELGIKVTSTMHLSPTVNITADRFIEAAKQVLNGAQQVEIPDSDGKVLKFDASLSNGDLKLTALNHTIEHPFVEVLSSKRDVRLGALERISAELVIGADRTAYWRKVLGEGDLTAAEYMDFVRDGRATPEMLFVRLQDRRNLDPAALVPGDLNYWSALLPMPEQNDDFAVYINGRLLAHQTHMLSLNPRVACSRIGYSAMTVEVVPFNLLQQITVEDLDAIVEKEDPFSLLFAFEIASKRLAAGPDWEGIGTRVLNKLFGSMDALTRRCELLSAGTVISYGRLSRLAEWRSAPLYWRRLAALSHAGVVADALGQMSQPDRFREWALKNVGPEFYWRFLSDRREGPLWWTDGVEPRALKALVAGRFINAMKKIDEAKWPTAWKAVAEGILKDTLEPSERAMLTFPGPMNDFVGYNHDVDPALFGETIKALQNAPFRIQGLVPFLHLAKLTEIELGLLKEFAARTVLPADVKDARLYIAELSAIGHAAGVYRNTALADGLADKVFELYKQTEGLEREQVLGLLVDAASANAEEGTYLSWMAQQFERLAAVSSPGPEVDVLRNVLASLISVDARFRAYFSRARALLEIKAAQNM
jgi:hypothetical protein